nr:RNA-directed DNA polymerase, eukaryota, reverse transcriptase zinc-binding domain protein [Tanacetum cinerariifolium]
MAKEVDGILHVLNEFHAQSGLKINIGKSNLYGVGVDIEDVSNMARASGCAAGSLPFSYLGLNMVANMACRSNWDILLQRFRNRLSNWKGSRRCYIEYGTVEVTVVLREPR